MGGGFSNTDRLKNKTDIWLTPKEYAWPLGWFDLDPCAAKNHKLGIAENNIYENGLDAKWHGRVWLNPPYSEVSIWLDKLQQHGRGIALVFARTDTRWAQKHMKLADSVFFLKGRIKFLRGDGTIAKNSAGHGNMYLAYGEKPHWPFDGWAAK